MKLTIEENRETIKRYGHIKPAPRWGSVRCSAKCPGSSRTCTLEEDHRGPHVAHGRFQKVLAVWGEGVKVRKPENKPGRSVGASAGTPLRVGGWTDALAVFRNRLVRRLPFSIEEGFLLILALAMVGFALDWALRILGLR
jgi:hypothetical protein